MSDVPTTSGSTTSPKPAGVPLRKVLVVMILFVLVYGAFAIYRGVGEIGERLRDYAWSTFVLGCALAFGNYVLRFFKWEFYLARLGLLRKADGERAITASDSFLTFLSGFVLTVTPGKVGEVFKSLVLLETHGVPVAKTAPIVVAERVTDLIGIIALIVVGSLGFSGGLVWAGVGSVLVLTLLVIVASRSISLTIIGIVEKLPGPFAKLGPKLHDAYESLAVLVAPRNLLWPTVLSVVAWFLECMSLYVILRGFGANVSIPLSTFFYATSTLAGALVPVPGGLGVTESALQGQLMELGKVPGPASTASMILVRFSTLWFAVLVGFIALSVLKRRYPKLLKGS